MSNQFRRALHWVQGQGQSPREAPSGSRTVSGALQPTWEEAYSVIVVQPDM
jgi:hypothetical protein